MTAHRAACFYANKGSGAESAEAPPAKAAGKAGKKVAAEKEEAVEEPAAAEKETTVKVPKKDKESELKEAPVNGTPI